MPASAASRAPREGAAAVLRFGRLAAMGTVAALILMAGVWASWGTAQHVMFTKGREQGAMTVTRCAEDVCTGPYTPTSGGSKARDRVEIERTVAVKRGQTYAVAVKPGSSAVVRTGPSGFLYAWVPFGGALLLTSVVVAGGLGLSRLGWVLGGSGLALITAAFVLL
ncbi:hypothetical protein E0500_004650 [Streptomyces sp. KM273126]|uniref:hypothetical protein n=1 Tax=Streptomyces sp. KM273126 TaxID=2545247 RepID=UPI00103F1DF6|nr:hypothetical protein [Streptomyces sp. KM273126]MBA2806759.1 hypothetical protein [Streptomyces sp. KM273126]